MNSMKPAIRFVLLFSLLLIYAFSWGRTTDCKGMTWVVKRISQDYVLVGNDKTTNPYQGDTSCEEELPILCIKKTGAPQPHIPNVRWTYYNGWCSGQLAVTPPVKGIRLTSLAETNRIVRSYLGPGWRIAEHHDGGGGWSIWGIGNLPEKNRFWVHINDQRGNPWNYLKDRKPIIHRPSPSPPPITSLKPPNTTKPSLPEKPIQSEMQLQPVPTSPGLTNLSAVPSTGSYRNGLRHGKWLYRYKTGKFKLRCTYHDGALHGDYIIYYPNGRVREEGQYLNGIKNGYWIYRNQKGSISAEGRYQNGLRIGEWKIYSNQPAQIQIGDHLQVLAGPGLHLRKKPNTAAALLTSIPYRTVLTVLNVSRSDMVIDNIHGFWVKVRYRQHEGYVFSGYLSGPQ